MIVVKFGGTSVGDAAAIVRAASITRDRLARRPVVVVSALSGTTNALLELARAAAHGQVGAGCRSVAALRDRHLHEATTLLSEDAVRDATCSEISELCDHVATLVEAVAVLGFVTPRSLDAIAAFGEDIASRLVAAAFRVRGLDARIVDPRQVVITDDRFTQATPQFDAIERACDKVLRPLIEEGVVPILGGYVGASADGVTTTLGRGGSDFSAALVGAALGAEAIEIWTDVDGMLTADPRLVPDARLIERMRFDEAAELAVFGAKVLHPATMMPAITKGIPVCIFNSFRPGAAGTWITAEAPLRAVTAIAGRSGVTIVKVRSTKMLLAPGFLRALFDVFARHETSVDVVATSEVSVSVTLDEASNVEAIGRDLAALGEVTVERDRAIIAVVGAGLGGHGGTMARALASLQGVHVHMVSVSATEINLTLVVDADRLPQAMRALHSEFFGAERAAEDDVRAHYRRDATRRAGSR